MAKLPKSIKIMNRDYKLIEENPVDVMRSGGVYGSFRQIDGEIRFTKVETSEDANTILHEMLHALWRYFDLDKDFEEHYIICLTNGLTTVMRDNPELFKNLLKMANGEN